MNSFGGSSEALPWSEFVEGIRAKRLAVSVDRMKAARIVDEGLLGKGEMWSQTLYSWMSMGLILAALPLGIWCRWYWGVASFVIGVVMWQSIKDSAGQFLIERCLKDERFFLACTKAGVLRVQKAKPSDI